jgi:tripartite-type tricarboxylate transporter receptor subunit TctC
MFGGRHSWVPAFAAATLLIVGSLLPDGSAQAQTAADFYRGKTIVMLCGIGVGGEFDLLTRLVGRHIVRHIPGNPASVTQNITGAGGMKMLNYLYAQAPRDGTVIGMVQTGLPAAQALGQPGIQFDAAKLHWLGTSAPATEVLGVWRKTGVASIDDARRKELAIGASARGSNTWAYPTLLNELFGTRFKVVTGYNAGAQINLAMERGEVDGRVNSWASFKANKPQWIKDKLVNFISRSGPAAPGLDAPSVEEMAKTPADRQLIELVLSGSSLGRPFAIAPGVPQDRVKALQAAFDATMQDPAFIAEAAAAHFEVAPVSGDVLQKTVEKIVSTPKEVVTRAKRLLEQ